MKQHVIINLPVANIIYVIKQINLGNGDFDIKKLFLNFTSQSKVYSTQYFIFLLHHLIVIHILALVDRKS